MSEVDRQRQLQHVNECLALCGRSPTKQELADAEHLLSTKPDAPKERQQKIDLRAA